MTVLTANSSLFQINLVKVSAVGKVVFGSLGPATKRFVDAEEFDFWQLFDVLGLEFFRTILSFAM